MILPKPVGSGCSLHRVKEYSAIIRFSNASAHVGPDLENNENSSRGMAIKVFGIDQNEKFLDKDHGQNNQEKHEHKNNEYGKS